MIGYWSGHCPVKTDHEKVLATVYKKKGKAMISIASWENGPAPVQLQIDWKQLGIDPKKAKIKAPAIRNFQEEKELPVQNGIPEKLTVENGKGWLLIVSEGL
jgi:hypothetical protein